MRQSNEEITIADLWQPLWSRRQLIAALTLVFGSIAAVVGLLMPAKYEATVLMAPVEDDAGSGKLGGAGALLSQFGGLAGLSGVSLGGSSRKAEFVATLQSATLTQTFIAENKLLPVLYQDKWDSGEKDWKSMPAEKVPTLWKAERLFRQKICKVSEDKKTGLITLIIVWKDPQKAAAWANELVRRANSYLRADAIEQSQKNLEYLNQELGRISVLELQKAIYGLIESEIKKIMIAKGSEQYAFRVIDPARVPERKSNPSIALMAIAGALAGLLAGILWSLFSSRSL